MILLVGIGLRAVLQRDALRRTVLVVVGAAVAAIACLVAVAGPQVTQRERSRADTRRPAATSLGFRLAVHDYQERRVTIAEVTALAPGAPTPPGVARIPSPGEALLSPALADRLAKDATLRRWFPYSWAVLPREAVGSAGQLLAYVGADPSSFDRDEFSRGDLVDFGFAANGNGGGRFPALGLLLFCVVPALALLAVCTRVGGRVQRRRTVALRMLGVSRRGTALVASVEIGPWAAIGGLIGWAGFVAASRVVDTLPIVGRRFFAEDAALPAPTALRVVVVVTVLAAGLSALGAISAARLARTSRPVLAHRPASPWTLAPAAAGAALLVWAYTRGRPRDPVLTAALVVYGVGLPSATMAISQRLAARLARRGVPTGVLLGLRKMESDPGRAVRVAGVAALAVYALGVAQPITQVLSTGGGDWVAAARRARPAGIVGSTSRFTTRPLRLERRAPSSLLTMLPIVDVLDRGSGVSGAPTALIASCGQVQALVTGPVDGCADQPPRFRAAGRGSGGPFDLAPGMLPSGAAVMMAPAMARANGVASHDQRGAVIEVQPTLAAWQDVQAWIVSANPGYSIWNFYQTNVRRGTVALWLVLGVTVASTLAVLSGAVLAFEAAWLRKREFFALRAIGVPRQRLRGAQVTEGVLAGGVAIGLAVIGAFGVAAVDWHMQRDDPFPALAPYFLAAAGGLGAVVGIAWLSSLVISKRLLRG